MAGQEYKVSAHNFPFCFLHLIPCQLAKKKKTNKTALYYRMVRKMGVFGGRGKSRCITPSYQCVCSWVRWIISSYQQLINYMEDLGYQEKWDYIVTILHMLMSSTKIMCQQAGMYHSGEDACVLCWVTYVWCLAPASASNFLLMSPWKVVVVAEVSDFYHTCGRPG